ncbi:MAG TPA: hypothetical protein VMT52_01470 [Planctomycetota bacterium]|nr:hypothetical protein [Planctomycetota bacterium]
MSRALPIFSIVLVYGIVESHVIAHTVSPARDGARYLSMALRFEEEPWIDVIRSSPDHAGYPVFLHTIFRVGRAAGVRESAEVILLAQVATSLAGLLLIVAGFFAARRVWGLVPAWAGMISFAALPRPAWQLADVLSDGLHAGFFAASAAFAIRGFNRSSARPFAAAGLAASAAYWVRVDALTLPTATAIALLVAGLAGKTRDEWPKMKVFRAAGLYLAGFIPGFAAFVAAAGRLSPKPVAEDLLLGAGAGPAGAVVAAGITPPALALGPTFEAVGRVVADLAQELQFLHVGTAALGLIVLARRARPARAGASGTLIAALVLCHTVVIVLVSARSGYSSGRYFLPVLPFIVAFGMWGLLEVSAWMRRPGKLPALVLAGVAASFAFSAPSLLGRRLHENHHGVIEAGKWIAGHIADGETLHDPYFYPSFLAGLRHRATPSPEPPEGSTLAHYVIADEGRFPGGADPSRPGEKAADFPRRPGDEERRVAVYRVKR